MMWPTVIVDDFFEDPNKIVKFSKTLKFVTAEDSSWPGTRTGPLHEVNNDFFLFSTRKIMSILYPMNLDQVKWRATQTFQRSNKEYGEAGWVHSDTSAEITSIIYLSDHANSGTALYRNPNFMLSPLHTKEKEKFYKNLKNKKKAEQKREESNKKYKKVLDMSSNFNRLVLFDAHHWHQATGFGNTKEDRLTLITFFIEVIGDGIKYPIPTMRRTT